MLRRVVRENVPNLKRKSPRARTTEKTRVRGPPRSESYLRLRVLRVPYGQEPFIFGYRRKHAQIQRLRPGQARTSFLNSHLRRKRTNLKPQRTSFGRKNGPDFQISFPEFLSIVCASAMTLCIRQDTSSVHDPT